MKSVYALLALASVSLAIECDECIQGMGMFPDSLLQYSDGIKVSSTKVFWYQLVQ